MALKTEQQNSRSGLVVPCGASFFASLEEIKAAANRPGNNQPIRVDERGQINVGRQSQGTTVPKGTFHKASQAGI